MNMDGVVIGKTYVWILKIVIIPFYNGKNVRKFSKIRIYTWCNA